jgi:CheY-like chemotaxis protein
MDNIRILWADDEIDLLKPQLLFLEKKGYEVTTVTNGYDALDEIDQGQEFDVVFLDESMPGIGGLETLSKIKDRNPHQQVVMITKTETEDIMEEAIGSQIDDYLIKPVNPNQILLTLKRLIDNDRLISEKTNTEYQQEFRKILMDINSGPDLEEWSEIYKKIINWELRLDSSTGEMGDILSMQKKEANIEFSRFVMKNYSDWINGDLKGPTFSHQLMKEKVFPKMDDKPTILLLFDNLRYDQWKSIEPIINEFFRIESEEYFYSILPTSTQYSRNSIFAGLLPLDIQKRFPKYWLNDNQEGGKNLKEKEFLADQITRLFRKEVKFDYFKVTNVASAKSINDNVMNFFNNDLTVVVYNFIDMLSHARTEMEVLKELANDEKAYRSLTRSWFVNSPIWQALKKAASKDFRLIITTDHGTIRVKQPSKVLGDRETTPNLRYKVGRNLKYDRRDVLEFRKPEQVGLPSPNMSSSYIFAIEDKYFLYPNNYNYYNNYYRHTFQHGGISMEEVICPFIVLNNR